MKMRLSWQLAVAALVGALVIGGWFIYRGMSGTPAQQAQNGQGGRRGAPDAPVLVDVDVVRTGRIVETRDAVGTVRALESITVTAKVAGIIDKINFEEGQLVKAGDLLAALDSQERQAEIEGTMAERRRASALKNEIATRLDRAQALRRTGAGTEAQVEDLSAQAATLDSAIAAAEAQRKAAEVRFEDLVIRAPFAGRVGTRSVSLGAYVSPGTRITTLDDLTKVRLDFAVPENLLERIKSGQIVHAVSSAFKDRVFDGKVSVIDPRIDPVTRSIRLTAEFENADEALRPGMFLSVSLEVAVRDNAIVVPEEAIVSEGLRHILYTVKDDKVDRRIVRIGQRQNGKVEVVEGLTAGETIIVRGVQRVRPGGLVNPRPVSGATNPLEGPAARREPEATPGSIAPRGTLNPASPAKTQMPAGTASANATPG